MWTEVSSGSLLTILKGKYLSKRRTVAVTNLNVIAELFLIKIEEELSNKLRKY